MPESDAQRELNGMLAWERKLSSSMHAAVLTARSSLPHNPEVAEGWLVRYETYRAKHQGLLARINAYPRDAR